MYITDCLPFSKGLNKEKLSYFGSECFEAGSLIKVDLRGKKVSALVLESKNVSESKTEIKTADFKLKKISSTGTKSNSKPFLQKEFMEALFETSRYFAAYPANIIPHLIPNIVLENPQMLSSVFVSESKIKLADEQNSRNGVWILQSPNEERFIHYRSLIREEFAKKKSVFLCLPQNEDVRLTKEKLEKGIESFVCAFHNNLTKNEVKSEWKKICNSTHPLLVISTAKWLFLPRSDFGTLVIDQENKNGWKTLSRPFFDLRFFAEKLAEKKKIRLLIGDTLLRTETLFRYKNGEIAEFENVKWRLSQEIKTFVVDLKSSAKKMMPLGKNEKDFKVLSPEIIELIKETQTKNSHAFIFAARKGLAPNVICRDCGEQVKCLNCDSPVVLYKTKIKTREREEIGGAFRCHQCDETRDAAEVCRYCGSWRLITLGIGIDRVAEEIKKEVPDVKIFQIHKDIAETETKARSIATNFYENRGSVLLGTEMAFSYLYKKIANSAIASFDSLFLIPDFRIREKIFGLILQIRDITKEKLLIQTRNCEDLIIKSAVSGNLAEFYKKEMEDRSSLNYPPFGIFIKITVRGTRLFTTKEAENLKKILQEYSPTIFSSVHEKRSEQSAINAVIKIPKEKWPDVNFLKIIKLLPPHFEIKVDPDSLL